MGALCPFRAELGASLIQCGLGRGLLPYQVASSSIQPFGRNEHGPKTGWWCVPSVLGVAGSPSNTKSPGPRPTSIPSGILMHPAVWQQYKSAKNWAGGLCPLFGGGELGPHLAQCGLDQAHLHAKCHLYSSSHLATIKMGRKLGALPPSWGEGSWLTI